MPAASRLRRSLHQRRLMAVAVSVCAWGFLISWAASAEVLVLQSGERFVGSSRSVEQGEVLWTLPDGDEFRVPLDWVRGIEVSESEKSSSDAPVSAPASEILPVPTGLDTGAEDPPWLEDVPFVTLADQTIDLARESLTNWTRRINFAGQFTDGNVQTDLINVTAEIEKGTPKQTRQIDIGGTWGRTGNRQTANRWFINSNFDWPLEEGSNWISFFTTKNEYDGPANLDYRGTLSTGIGYRFFNDSARRLITRWGPAYTIEVFQNPSRHRESPDIFSEIEMRWPVLTRTSFEQRLRVQPSILDFELVRVFSNTALLIDLDDQSCWKLRLGLQYTYNSQPAQDKVPSDYISTVSLVYQRK